MMLGRIDLYVETAVLTVPLKQDSDAWGDLVRMYTHTIALFLWRQ